MSFIFRALHTSNFYTSFHTQAVAKIGYGRGKWADIGCGPGVLTRTAAKHGYTTTGFDISADMIHDAQALSPADVHFVLGGLDDVENDGYDVVSASSLIVVTQNHSETIKTLIKKAHKTGTVLCIEAAPTMGYRRAFRWIYDNRPSIKETLLLLLWVTIRRGRTVDPNIFREHGFTETKALNDMVSIWIRR